MDLKDLDRISHAVLHRAITGARAKLNIPVSYENDPIFFQGPEFQRAVDAVSSMVLAYERHVQIMADPDACASVAPQIQEQRERVARIKDSMARHADVSKQIIISSVKPGYAHKFVLGRLPMDMESENALLMIQHEYDMMPFGYRDFVYNKHTGYFSIIIHTD